MFVCGRVRSTGTGTGSVSVHKIQFFYVPIPGTVAAFESFYVAVLYTYSTCQKWAVPEVNTRLKLLKKIRTLIRPVHIPFLYPYSIPIPVLKYHNSELCANLYFLPSHWAKNVPSSTILIRRYFILVFSIYQKIYRN